MIGNTCKVHETDKKFLLSRSPLAIRIFQKEALFFFEKKNQKTFSRLGLFLLGG
jgi:hypothetical protein